MEDVWTINTKRYPFHINLLEHKIPFIYPQKRFDRSLIPKLLLSILFLWHSERNFSCSLSTLVSFAAVFSLSRHATLLPIWYHVIWLVNRRYRQTKGKECGSKESNCLWGGGLRDVTSLKTAAKETKVTLTHYLFITFLISTLIALMHQLSRMLLRGET